LFNDLYASVVPLIREKNYKHQRTEKLKALLPIQTLLKKTSQKMILREITAQTWREIILKHCVTFLPATFCRFFQCVK